jgi:hypothetical protein
LKSPSGGKILSIFWEQMLRPGRTVKFLFTGTAAFLNAALWGDIAKETEEAEKREEIEKTDKTEEAED